MNGSDIRFNPVTMRVIGTRWAVAAVLGLVGLAIAIIGNRDLDDLDAPWALLTPKRDTEIATRMAELREQGRFDDAITVVLHSEPNNSPDAFLLQAIAETYFMRAIGDKDNSGKWTRLAADYSERALNADSRDLANVFNAGINFKIVGDTVDTGGCAYYKKAEMLFSSLAPRLQGKAAETQGRTVSLTRFRRRNDEELSGMRTRLRHCPTGDQ